MTIHRNLIEGIGNIIQEIFSSPKSTEYILQEHIQANKKWGSRDRRLIQSSVFTIQRNYILLQHLFNTTDIKTLVEKYLSDPSIINTIDDSIPYPIRYSIPPALDAIGISSIGKERWQEEMKAMHQPGSIFLRIHQPEKNLKHIQHELDFKEIKYEIIPFEFVTDKQKKIAFKTILLFSRTPIKNFTSYQKGWFDIQDPGSQAIAYFASPENGQIIVDGCCGNGGKLTGMMLIAPKASFYGMDVYEYKLNQLSQRITRLRLSPAKLHLATQPFIHSLKDTAHLVLLDVPCTGSGTLRRQAELKYKINSDSLTKTIALQKSILENQSMMVKKGGTLIYSTCSILNEENQEVIDSFIQTHPSFEPIDKLQIIPSEQNTDGFFMASFKRN